MKKIGAFLLTFALLAVTMIPSSLAAANNWQDTETVYSELGDVEIITTIHYAISRSGGSANKTSTVKSDGKVIAEVTLSATFGYDGKTAWVSNASSSHTTYSGWSYGSEKITKSGGTASLTGTLSHLLHRNISVNISLTCSPTGQIS